MHCDIRKHIMQTNKVHLFKATLTVLFTTPSTCACVSSPKAHLQADSCNKYRYTYSRHIYMYVYSMVHSGQSTVMQRYKQSCRQYSDYQISFHHLTIRPSIHHTIQLFSCVLIYVCMYVCIYVCMYVCVCIYLCMYVMYVMYVYM